jgi:transposase
MKGMRLFVDRKEELEHHLQEETDPAMRLKLAFLKGFTLFAPQLDELCQAFGIATSTGYWWIRTWNRQGYEGIREQGKRTGCPPKLNDWDIVYLRTLLVERPYWTTAEVRELIHQEFGVLYSPDQVVRILRQRLKMYLNKPFPRDYRRPDDAEQRLKADLKEAFEVWGAQGYRQRDIAIGFLDESSPQNRANTVRVWSFETSPKVIKNTMHFKSNTMGFYAVVGNSVQSFLNNSKKESIVEFLKAIRAANPSFKAMIIVLDNYSSHISAAVADVAQALGIYLVFLPPYSPDLNPIEYIWKSIKRVVSVDFVSTLDEMKRKIASAWNDFSGRLSFAKRWIEQFLKGQRYYSDLRA